MSPRHRRGGVAEQFGREIGTGGLVERGRHGLTESVRDHLGKVDAGRHEIRVRVADGPPEAPYVGRAHQRAALGVEHGVLGWELAGRAQPLAQGGGREAGDGDRAPVPGVLRVRLSEEALAADVDDGPGDRHRGWVGIEVDVAAADGEGLTETGRGAEHDLEDLGELAVRRRTREPRLRTVFAQESPDLGQLVDGERPDLRS